MAFTRYKLVSYEAVQGTERAETLLQETQRDLTKLLSRPEPGSTEEEEPGLTQEEKCELKTLTGLQSGFFKVFVLIPFDDQERISKAFSQIWDPELLTTRVVDLVLEVGSNESQ
jgi:hypothetical protein